MVGGKTRPTARRAARIGALAATALWLGAGGAAFALSPPEGDLSARIAAESARMLQATDAEASVRQQGPGVVSDPLNRRDLPPPGGPTVLLKSVTFTPASAFLSEAELAAIRAKYIGRRLDFAGLSELVRDVNDLYAEKGVVTATAILAPQNVEGGDLVISLIEGQVGVVAVVGEHQTRTGFITNRVRFARGTTVDVPTAAKDISFFNQTNRAQLRLLLQPGAAFGLTDLVFGITEPTPQQVQFFLDNNGIASTGDIRASHIFRRYGLLGVDDTFLLFLEASEGSRSATARYDFAFTPIGTRLGLSASASDYNVVAGPSVALDLTGRAQSTSITLTQPIYASDRFVLQATAAMFRGDSVSFSAGVPLVDAYTTKFAPGFTFAAFGDNWTVSTQMQAVFATVTDNLAATSADYVIGTGSIDGAYRFANGISFIGRGGWQTSEASLLPGNLLFQIGGPTTVRGYPSDGVAGDSGFYANLELHKTFSVNETSFNGYVFADLGEVYSTFPAVTSMASAGVGAAYNFNEKVRLEVSAAVPLRDAVANQDDVTLSATLTFTQF
ncbi:MAG: BamA/TamA family outer membrane protein [Rhodobacteraceae bacterium]|nr:BamA/TamA family outer membrane protein [Paracoccaceae bacterium]